MKTGSMRTPLLVLLVGAALAVGLAACTSDGGDTVDQDGAATEEPRDGDATPTDPEIGRLDNGEEAGAIFIGLPQDEAAILAESEGRAWRVGSEDGVEFPLTADHVPGRVTFALEQSVVTGVNVEPPLEDDRDPSTSIAPDDANAAAILAASVKQILTVDHSFGVGSPPPFDDVRVATAIGGTSGAPLAPLQLESIAAAVEATGATVEFTSDPRALIDELFDANQPGVAVVTVSSVDVDGDRAEVGMDLWCGSLCGVFLTYEAVLTDGAWTVTGPIGPIAVS